MLLSTGVPEHPLSDDFFGVFVFWDSQYPMISLEYACSGTPNAPYAGKPPYGGPRPCKLLLSEFEEEVSDFDMLIFIEHVQIEICLLL